MVFLWLFHVWCQHDGDRWQRYHWTGCPVNVWPPAGADVVTHLFRGRGSTFCPCVLAGGATEGANDERGMWANSCWLQHLGKASGGSATPPGCTRSGGSFCQTETTAAPQPRQTVVHLSEQTKKKDIDFL